MNIKVYLVVFIANKSVLISRKTEYVSVALTLVIPSFFWSEHIFDPPNL